MENVLKDPILKADFIPVTHCDTQLSSYICVAGRCGKGRWVDDVGMSTAMELRLGPSPVSSEDTRGRAGAQHG